MTAEKAVVVSFDENYLMPGLVAATTAAHHTSTDIRVAILGVCLTDEAKELIKRTIPADRLDLIEAGEFAEDMMHWGHISNAAWGRIGIGSLLPASIQRVVYLDADTLIRRDLGPLFDLDLEGQTLAACPEMPFPTHHARHLWGQSVHPEFNYKEDCPVTGVASYFNSGVLIIDLERWRATEVESRIVDYASTLPESYVLLDQDALNTLLWDDWLLIEWKLWNWPGYLKDFRAWETHVVHFIGTSKPWDKYPWGAPFVLEYRKAAAAIGWKTKPSRERIRSGLIEAVVPYALVLRRKKIARLARSWPRSAKTG